MNHMQELYSVSPALFMKVERIGESIHRKFQGRVSLLEYITLPEMGQHVVLRFELRGKVSGLNEIDAIENKLSQWVGEDFWAVLVGETYRRVEPPLPWAALPTGLEKFSQVVAHEPGCVSIWGRTCDLLPPLIKASAEDGGTDRNQTFRTGSGPAHARSTKP